MVDSHDIAERARLLSHRLYAERLKAQPDLLEAARTAMTTTSEARELTVGQVIWCELLRADLAEIVRRMLDEGEEGRLLRTNSPFSIVIGVDDPEDRISLWRQAKADLSDRTISIARSAA